MPAQRRTRHRWLFLLALGALCAAGGCYQRVIRSEGPSAARQNVEEPYQGSYLIDDLLFGETVDGKRIDAKRRDR
ncbi:MAG: hypothetical protein EA379_10780 [Phycisphaerales bacterium]|nr:MAG: hypothetical protein EA379_10780 [Phycisphaerales bacterium]